MDEMVPRGGTESAAGWDGIERRAQPTGERRRRAGLPPWRDPQRLSGSVLAQVLGSVGASVVLGVAAFVAAHLQWR
ncbi:hypothetical protein [Streptomyces sp. NRRL B-24484]|uniref:hypothetical protein n=1 Tax=Streptomyces sp. NRRL B-24484 TaxID=1463833 RepID=UPI000A87A10D|nr:hypothetical protein [Streptomyces sp. NRRL B-24484]